MIISKGGGVKEVLVDCATSRSVHPAEGYDNLLYYRIRGQEAYET